VYSTRAGTNDLRYRYARWDAETGAWKEGQVAFAGNYLYPPEFDYAGGIALDPEDVNTLYFSSNVEPRDGSAVPGRRYEVYRAVTRDRGASWQIAALTRDSPEDNIRPFVPQGCPMVLWCRGTYSAYDRYKTRVVGLAAGP
jgi:hypothetical protein